MIMELEFGDYCLIEQKRYRGDNQMFLYKVVSGGMSSNVYRSVPVDGRDVLNGKEESRGEICDVILAIQCGVDETKVETFRLKDVKSNTKFKASANINFNKDKG